jgi:hypothetical protein
MNTRVSVWLGRDEFIAGEISNGHFVQGTFRKGAICGGRVQTKMVYLSKY